MKQQPWAIVLWGCALALRLGWCAAWGTVGHEIVANLAWRGLSGEVRAWLVDEVLGPFPNATKEAAAGSPLGAVADWADAVRHYMPWSAGLHYIDVRDDLVEGGCHASNATEACAFDYARDCPGDACVAGAILNYTQRLVGALGEPRGSLRSSRAVDPTVRQYMMFLVHFVGDLHQPLHCARTSDKGGNDFHVHFSLPSQETDDADSDEAENTALRRRTARTDPRHDRRYLGSHHHHHHSWNLHSVWDTGLIEVALERDYEGSRTLLEDDLWEHRDAAPGTPFSFAGCPFHGECPVVAWGRESWDAALRYAYTLPPDNTTDVEDGATLTEAYYETRWPIAKDRLLTGGLRLGAVLEAVYEATRSPAAAALVGLRHSSFAWHGGGLSAR